MPPTTNDLFHPRRRDWLRWLAVASASTATLPAWAEPDEEVLGKSLRYPLGNAGNWYQNPYRVASWSDLHSVPGIRSRKVTRAAQAGSLPRAAQAASIRYRFRNLGYTLNDYLDRQRTTGLLVLKNGEIHAEHYRYGRKEDARFLSFSMAKSVTALLIGQAQARGRIASLDDLAQKYAIDFAGSAYGSTSIRHLLRMSSGLTFSERYDGNDDIARLSRASAGGTGGPSPMQVLRSITDRHSPAGEKFVYASAETDVLGRILTAATGRNMAELTEEWLWKPMGAEHDAYWRTSIDSQEQAYGGFNASLRDWARLGMLLANNGKVSRPDGSQEQVLPLEFLLDATDAERQPGAFRPLKATPHYGYGYQIWLLPLRERTFAFQGIHGQAVYVQPASGIVMVHTSVWEHASGRQDAGPYQEREALWRGVLQSLDGSTAA